ncbi:DUF3667 domain-containing protein [Roseateles paludis]|uniref:DUF3667 domain-containing protein n=1 Tax=Roseateles paludis TaxID=3145238 RepID=A0ABV0FZ43_9BURK
MSSATHHLAPSHCPNCAQDLDPHDRFCRHCGQDTANHPPTLFEFVHEFVAHYVAAEGALWKSLAGLMFRPGYLTREYLAGRKQRYVLPLRLLLTLGLLFFFTLKLVPAGVSVEGTAKPTVATAAAAASDAASAPASGVNLGLSSANKAVNFQVSSDVADALPGFLQDRARRAIARWQRDADGAARSTISTLLAWAPYAVLASLPFFAGLLKLFYRRTAYGAHFVFALHLHAAWYLMLTALVLTPWGYAPAVVMLWASAYAWLALRKVYGASWLGTTLRAIPLALLHCALAAVGYTGVAIAGALSVG